MALTETELDQLCKDVVVVALDKEKSLRAVRSNFRIKMGIAGLYCYSKGLDDDQVLGTFRKKSEEILARIVREDGDFQIVKKGFLPREYISLRDVSQRMQLLSDISERIASCGEIDSISILSATLIKSTLLQKVNINIPKDVQDTFMLDFENRDAALYKICKKMHMILASNY